MPEYGTPEWYEYVERERARLTELYGEVWDTDQVTKRFRVHGFSAPFCTATDQETGERVVLAFQHSPRLYWRA